MLVMAGTLSDKKDHRGQQAPFLMLYWDHFQMEER